MKFFLCIAALFFVSYLAFPQSTPRKPLPRNVNVPQKHQIAPALSGDGRSMIYMTTYSESRQLEFKESHQTGPNKWTEPGDIQMVNRSTPNNLDGGYFYSYDGNSIFFTSKKANGIGYYDIWMVKKQASGWSAPMNLGKPVNTTGNEGAPSLSPDGETLYFMSCEKMSKDEAEGCKIMMATRKNSQLWNPPVPLPSVINSGGNEGYPRILGDGKTLLFTSSRSGGKGGIDLYQSVFENGSWSKPVNVDYLNTPEDDIYASIPLKGDVAYYSAPYRGYQTIIMAQIPENLRPSRVVYLQGESVQADQGADAFVQVYDFKSLDVRDYARANSKGAFSLIMAEGEAYDVSVTPKSKDLLYWARVYDTSEMEHSLWEKPEIHFLPLRPGTEWVNENVGFDEQSCELEPTTTYELKRLIRILKQHPDLRMEIEVYMDEVIEDSIRSSDDLTEIRYDTVEVMIDSMVLTPTPVEPLMTKTDSLDTAIVDQDVEQLLVMDTSYVQIPQTEVKTIYHNDRTIRKAASLQAYFQNAGVPEERVTVVSKGDENNLVPNDSPENRKKNRRVVVRLL